MAERPVSTGEESSVSPAASSASGSVTPIPDDSSQDKASLELEVANKRLRSQERAHQRGMRELKETVDALKTQLTEALQQRSSSDSPIILPTDVLNALDPNDPKDKILLSLYQNQAQWSKRMRDEADAQTRDAQVRASIGEAIEDEVEAGVPRAELLSAASPEAVHAVAERWRGAEEIRSLRAAVAELSQGRQTAGEAARSATLRARQELGATTTLTSTGEQPPLPSAVQQELDRLEEQIALAKHAHRGNEVIRLRREQQLLVEEATISAVP